MMFWLQWRNDKNSQGGHGGQVFTREEPLEMKYCQISSKIPLCSQKDFSSFPDLPYRCSPKWSLFGFTRMPWETLKQRCFMETLQRWQSPAVGPWLRTLWTCLVWAHSPGPHHGLLAFGVPAPQAPQGSVMAGFQKKSEYWTPQCWNSLSSSPAISWILALRSKGAGSEQMPHWQQLWR